MNHLGDTNKMVDTPRTDEAQFGTGRVSVSFARQLERELNEANDRIKRMEEENNELRAEEARLLNTNGELERRIKRLEEVAEDLVEQSDIYIRRQEWRKAKEAKL